jgi:hypothetical protein
LINFFHENMRVSKIYSLYLLPSPPLWERVRVRGQ